MPKKAATHIQKMAPGPPEIMAVAQPVMLPVPTWAAMEVATAWKELMPSLPAFSPLRLTLPNSRRKPVPNFRTWIKPGADGEDDAGAHQQIQQQPVPHEAGQLADLIGQQIHVHSFSLLVRKRNGLDSLCPAQQRDGPLRPRRKGHPLTLSFYLRDSAGLPALHLRYSSLSFSRATSIPSPHPVPGRLRVLLLRQACAISLGTSFAFM